MNTKDVPFNRVSMTTAQFLEEWCKVAAPLTPPVRPLFVCLRREAVMFLREQGIDVDPDSVYPIRVGDIPMPEASEERVTFEVTFNYELWQPKT